VGAASRILSLLTGGAVDTWRGSVGRSVCSVREGPTEAAAGPPMVVHGPEGRPKPLARAELVYSANW
jgi:hypothetical protein